jgi:heavy metal sensor kinase
MWIGRRLAGRARWRLARLPERRRWPVRWWLSILTAAIAGGTLLVLGGLLLVLLDGRLQRQLADYLQAQAQPVIERELGAPPPLPPPGPPRPFGKPSGKPRLPDPADDPATATRLRDLAGVLIRELSGRDTGIVVYDQGHRVVAISSPGERRERWPTAPPEALGRAAGGDERVLAVSQATRRTLVVLMPLKTASGEIIGVLEVATSLELADTLRAQLGVALAVGTLLTALIAGGLAAWVTRIALGPLDQMIRVTRRIAGGDLAARVHLEQPDEIGELAAAFDQMVGRLEAAFATQRRLVSDAAHELRTPLNGLAGTLEIVQVALGRGDTATAERLLATVERELDRAGRLVNDLLTLSRLDEQSPMQPSPVALQTVLRDVVRRARLLAPDHEIVARLDGDATVTGDRDQLERVFTNLLDNAVKYTPAGGRIELSERRQGDEVCVTVQDTGRGIPADDLPRIFDRFYRADRARARQDGGTGLGLAIVQGIVQAHGGRVEAESTPEAGTMIRVLLPGSPVGGVATGA